jgi:hypothetical protein
LPFIGRLHDPIEGDKQTGNDFSHAQYSFDANLLQRHFVSVNLDMKRLKFADSSVDEVCPQPLCDQPSENNGKGTFHQRAGSFPAVSCPNLHE